LILLAWLLLAAATLLSALSGLLSLLARVLLLATLLTALVLLTHIVPLSVMSSTTNNAGTSGRVPPPASYPLPKVPFLGNPECPCQGGPETNATILQAIIHGGEQADGRDLRGACRIA
jgi:hypothetical protein